MAFISSRSCMRIMWTATVTLAFLSRSSAAPTIGDVVKSMMYLARYGYLSPSVTNPSSGQLMDEDSWKRAIAEFQSFAGLNATGELDEETTKVMSLPRCGVRDKVGFGGTRVKRFALQGSKWNNKQLTYKISKYSSQLNHAIVDTELAKAFAVWSQYTDLTFTQKRFGNVHNDIRFEKGAHGDQGPFDGPGNILAHAFFPVFGGSVHFDDDENWTIHSSSGTNLFQAAAHEFGHSLGLAHSNVPSALMGPFYKGYDPAFHLHQDDIKGIQALYGRKSHSQVPSVPRVTTPQTSVEDPALCGNPAFPRWTAFWWLVCRSAPRGTVTGVKSSAPRSFWFRK